ncbi:unnamed protein product [Chondrus crispus]|uniref:Uncharacterized protein n=1 Tax=Chondrus crispus TaxID=2769 RepID=R7Q9T8_CHOCR|nr:unnamed protein product [Chondrus crispus]CDF34824.1 unnamed protein product [Chondrus crispus]|eukprot:XP_005714643.1 unnamed protein product [Chondrus crispus]
MDACPTTASKGTRRARQKRDRRCEQARNSKDESDGSLGGLLVEGLGGHVLALLDELVNGGSQALGVSLAGRVQVGGGLVDDGLVLVELRLQDDVVDALVALGHGKHQERDEADLEDVPHGHARAQQRLDDEPGERDHGKHEPVLEPGLLLGHVRALDSLERLVAGVQQAQGCDGDSGHIVSKRHVGDGRGGVERGKMGR